MMEFYIFLFIIGIGIMALLTLISMIYGDNVSIKEDYRVHQVKKQEARKKTISDEEKKKQLVDSLSKPLMNTVFEHYRPKNADLIRRKLRVTGWNKYFTPLTWEGLRIWAIAIAAIFLWLLSAKSWPAAIVISVVIIKMPDLLLNNEYNNIRDSLIMDFPETIRIISGYLSVGLVLQSAFEMTAKTAKPRWKRILNTFVSKCGTEGELEALNWIKEEVDIMEAREFFASVRLALEDGISPVDSFEKQATIIQRLLDDAIQKRIEKRKLLGTVLQGPLLLLILVTFALPIVGTIMDFF